MATDIEVIEEDGTSVKYFGYIDEENTHLLTEAAKKNNAFKCLFYLDPCGNTVFNEEQVRQVKKELAWLMNNSSIDKNVLLMIDQACDEALTDNHMYLKFVGD